MNVYVVTEELIQDLFRGCWDNLQDAIEYAEKYALINRNEWFYTSDKPMSVFQVNLDNPTEKILLWRNLRITKKDLKGVSK